MDYDSPWKEVVEDLFEAFLSFFFLHIHKEIDFSKGYQFLKDELKKIIKGSKTGKRYADQLVKVYLRDGSEQWLLIHIEIQGYRQKAFSERMYIYNYRIFDKFRRDVISLALLTDDSPKFRPSEYRRSRLGCEVTFRYPIVKVIDYRDQWAELEANPHPFAIVVKAYLKTLETKGNIQQRYSWKKTFLLELYQRGMTRETLLAIYKFIDCMMEVPEEMDKELHEDIKTREEKTMPYITTAERIGMKKGIEQGMAQGIATIIETKFGEFGQPLIERTKQMQDAKTLQQLMKKLLLVQSLPEAEKIFNELEVQA